MNNIPVLSICIPTFNRLNYLRELLEILLPQVQSKNVEVCVSDNHSSDGTPEFLINLSHKYPFLRCVFNSQNIGLDKNMLAVIAMGTGKYIYPIGDDDIIPKHSLSAILSEVSKGGDVIVLNGWHTNPALDKVRLHLPESLSGYYFSRADQAFISLWDKMPFGSFIALRECFSKEYSHRFVGTSHAYTGAVWDALADIEEDKGLCHINCMRQPTVLLRGAEKSWRKDAALITLYEIPIWFSMIMEKDVYRKIIPSIRSEYLVIQTKFNSLIQLRAVGQLNKSDVYKLVRECTPDQIKKINMVAMLPSVIAQIIVRIQSKIKVILINH